MRALSRKLDAIAPLLARILLEGHPESHQLPLTSVARELTEPVN
jgi:hypothetical protein